jgi:hypothetical protein
VSDYPFLVRALPLQPLDCVKKMAVWEKLLFKDMEATAAQQLRKRKQIEIVTFDPAVVGDEIAKIKKAEIVRVQKEKEMLEASKVKGNLLGALKEKFSKKEEESIQATSEMELSSLQVGSIDDIAL